MSEGLIERARRGDLVVAIAAALLITGCGLTPVGQANPPSSALAETAAPPTPTASIAMGGPLIVYQGGDGGPSRVRLVRPDGTDDHVLVDGLVQGRPDGWYQHPDWSHDGQR